MWVKYLSTASVDANTLITDFSTDHLEGTIDHASHFGVNDSCRDGLARDPTTRTQEEKTIELILPHLHP